MIEKYLEDLERRINPEVEQELYAQWKEFTDGRFKGDMFTPRRREAFPSSIEWPEVCINDAIEDYELMALQQFSLCNRAVSNGSGGLMNVRANYGTGIMSSVFGAEMFVMDRSLNTLPTTRPLGGGCEDVKRLIDSGVPDLETGLGEKTFRMGQYLVEKLDKFPKVARYVCVYHPDMQGPMDICELLWGSSLFIDLVDQPDLVKSFLELITETYVRFMRRWNEIAPLQGPYAVHWTHMHRGFIMLRDDSAMNLSPQMFEEFVEPFDQRVLDEFGGGGIHFCGRGDHFIHRFPEMKGVHAVCMSQPEWNDMEIIFQNTVDRGIKLVGLKREAAEAALKRGRSLHGNVHAW